MAQHIIAGLVDSKAVDDKNKPNEKMGYGYYIHT